MLAVINNEKSGEMLKYNFSINTIEILATNAYKKLYIKTLSFCKNLYCHAIIFDDLPSTILRFLIKYDIAIIAE